MEVKLLAVEALESGADRRDVAAVIGVGPSTVGSWHKRYRDGGVSGMCRKASSIAVRKQRTKLEEKILARRRVWVPKTTFHPVASREPTPSKAWP